MRVIVSIGAAVSPLTVTVNVHALVLAEPSVAVHVTVVLPSGNVEPLAGSQVTVTLVQLSVAVAAKVTTVPFGLLQFVVMFTGQLICGGCISRIVTVKVQLVVLPQLSVAVHVTVVEPSGKVEPGSGRQDTVTSVSHASMAAGDP